MVLWVKPMMTIGLGTIGLGTIRVGAKGHGLPIIFPLYCISVFGSCTSKTSYAYDDSNAGVAMRSVHW